MNPAILAGVFLLVFAAAAVAASTAWNVQEEKRRKKLDKRLKRSVEEQIEAEGDLLRKDLTSGVQFYGRLLERYDFTRAMRKHLSQARLNWSVGRLTAMMLVSAFLVLNIVPRLPLAIPIYVTAMGALLAGAAPYLYVLRRRTKRMAMFEEQFPEALDFLGRALRAGHAFSISLEMLSEEGPEPLASEFRQTFDEQNLGLPAEAALQNLAKRMPLLDVRFFVSAVLLQTRTGGNLSEILDKLAYVIRERFKLKGHVRAVSAHGRLTAKVLTVMPIVVVILMMMVNPKYLMVLAKNPYGKHMIFSAAIMQCLAYLIMRRIVNIKV